MEAGAAGRKVDGGTTAAQDGLAVVVRPLVPMGKAPAIIIAPILERVALLFIRQ